jgi:hypothetical protein
VNRWVVTPRGRQQRKQQRDLRPALLPPTATAVETEG